MAVEIGPRIKVDGEAQYRAELNNIIQQGKALAAQMQAVTAAFDKNTTAEERAQKAGALLEKQIDNQKLVLLKLKQGLDQSVKATGENSTETYKWQQAVANAERKLAGLEKQLTETTEETQKNASAENAAAGQVDNFTNATDRSTTALNAKAVVIGQIITDLARKTAELIKQTATIGIEYDREMERYTSALSASLGSTEAAAKALAAIKVDAVNAPLFSVSALTQANQMLIATGESAEDARATINALSEAVAATGGGNAELTRMAQNLQQIKNTGKATSVDIKQFGNAGIDIYGVLADYTGKTTQEVKNLDFSYSLLSKALQVAAKEGGRYYGANAVQAETLNGQINALTNSVRGKLGEAFQGVADTLRDKVLPQANDFVKSLDPKEATDALGDFVTVAITAGGAMKAIAALSEFDAFVSSMTAAGVALSSLSAAEQAATINAALMKHEVSLSSVVMAMLSGTIDAATAKQLLWNAATAAFPAALIVTGVAAVAFAVKKGIDAQREWVDEQRNVGETAEEVRANLANLEGKLADLEAQAKEGLATDIMYQSIDNYKIAIAETRDRLAELEAAEAAAAEQEQIHAAYLETTEGKCETLTSSIGELIAGYQEAYTEAEKSLSGQFGLFEKASAVTNISVADILTALQSQADYFNAYAGNLNTLEGMTAAGIGLNADLVAQINDGSAQSVQYASSLVAGYQEALAQGDDAVRVYVDNVNKAFENQQKAMSTAADAIAKSKTGIEKALNEMVTAAARSAADMDQSMAMRNAAVSTVQGYIDGAAASAPALIETMQSLGAAARAAFDSAVGNIGGGFATGGRVNGSHATGLDYVPYDGYIARLHKGETILNASLAAAYRRGDGVSKTTNMGGISINVYGGDGQSVDDIADAVAFKLQRAVEGKAAVFS